MWEEWAIARTHATATAAMAGIIFEDVSVFGLDGAIMALSAETGFDANEIRAWMIQAVERWGGVIDAMRGLA